MRTTDSSSSPMASMRGTARWSAASSPLRERRQRVDLSAFLFRRTAAACRGGGQAPAGTPPVRAPAQHRPRTARQELHSPACQQPGQRRVCERILASARQLQQHQVELCLLLAIDEQEPALGGVPGVPRPATRQRRIALHPQRIDTDARQCFAEVDAGLCDYLGLDARLLAPRPADA